MARSAIILLPVLATLGYINCQSYGTVPTTLARIESRLEDVSETSTQVANTTDQTATLLESHNQLMATMVGLLQKHDQHLDNLAEQQTVQNQILTMQTTLLQDIMKQQNIQNQILTNVVGLLQRHDEQMDNMNQQLNNITEQKIAQNHILSAMSNLLQKQDQQLEKQDQQLGNMSDLLSQQQQSQTQMISSMASSLQNITER